MNRRLDPFDSSGVRPGPRGGAPGHRTRILVVDGDASAVEAARSILRTEGWEVISAETAAEALNKARLEGVDAILSELNLPDMNGLDFLRTLRQRGETASTPIVVLTTSAGVGERVAGLRSGASDYLVKPPNAQDLIARLKAALDLRRERSGFVVAVFGGKGGVGTSVVAANLAVALRRETRAGVALLDAASPLGAADVFLNLQAKTSVAEVLTRLDDLEPGDLEGLLSPHASGLQVLLLEAQGAVDVRPEEIRKLLVALRRIRDFVVVDTSAWFDGRTATILDLADRVLVVLTPEITALRGARLLLQMAEQTGVPRERLAVVLNRFPLRGGLQRRDMEGALGLAAWAAVPDDVRLITYSINRGVPIVESHPRSGVARQVGGLVKLLLKAARPG